MSVPFLTLVIVLAWPWTRLAHRVRYLLLPEAVSQTSPTYPMRETDGTYSYRYWTLNPGQDTIDVRESPPDPVQTVIRSRRSRSEDRSRTETKSARRERTSEDVAYGNGYKPNDSAV